VNPPPGSAVTVLVCDVKAATVTGRPVARAWAAACMAAALLAAAADPAMLASWLAVTEPGCPPSGARFAAGFGEAGSGHGLPSCPGTGPGGPARPAAPAGTADAGAAANASSPPLAARQTTTRHNRAAAMAQPRL
jgi:hypothetical protein